MNDLFKSSASSVPGQGINHRHNKVGSSIRLSSGFKGEKNMLVPLKTLHLILKSLCSLLVAFFCLEGSVALPQQWAAPVASFQEN